MGGKCEKKKKKLFFTFDRYREKTRDKEENVFSFFNKRISSVKRVAKPASLEFHRHRRHDDEFLG